VEFWKPHLFTKYILPDQASAHKKKAGESRICLGMMGGRRKSPECHQGNDRGHAGREWSEAHPDPVAETIDRAFRASFFSFLLFPLTLYSSYLLLGLVLNQNRIPSRSWGKLLFAVLVSTPFSLVVLGVSSWLFSGLLKSLFHV
jgi:hypothetical protein